MKNLRKTLLGSIVSLLICFTMLLGTTFAWFTDSVSSTGNVIMSGNLDVDVLHLTDTGYVSLETDTNHKVFDYELWEPGYTQVETLKIDNKGNLAFKYEMKIFADNTATYGPNNAYLADVIDVYMCFGESTATSADDLADTTKWWHVGKLSDFINTDAVFTSGKMLPDGVQYDGTTLGENGVMEGECTASVALHMQETANNDYQNLTLGNVYISLIATQWTFEEDSFNDQYDANAEYPAHNEPNAPVTPTPTCEHTDIGYTDNQNGTHTSYCKANCGTYTGATTNCEDTDSNNACDKCGYDMTPATPACEHTNIGYTDNQDGTHTSYCEDCTDYTGTTADCADGDSDGLCDVCGGTVTPATPSTPTTVTVAAYDFDETTQLADWSCHWGETDALSIENEQMKFTKISATGNKNKAYTTNFQCELTAGVTYLISADITACDAGDIGLSVRTELDDTTDPTDDKSNILASDNRTFTDDETLTLSFTFTPSTTDTYRICISGWEEPVWNDGIDCYIDNVTVTYTTNP